MTTSPVKAIREFCLSCCGGSAADVKGCTSQCCSLKPFRFGKNPYIKREMTEEQKAQARERLAAARRRAKVVDEYDGYEDLMTEKMLSETIW